MVTFISRVLEALRPPDRRGNSGQRVKVSKERQCANSLRRVLVVDDEAQIVRLMEVNLDRAGFVVDTASSVDEAQMRIKANLPDVVVTDAMMPEIDGFELLKRIRHDPITANIPVVILAPVTKEGNMDYYFTKPFHPQELVALVERLCDKL